MDQGPDIIYIVDFVYIQVVVTGLICLIFLPKVGTNAMLLNTRTMHYWIVVYRQRFPNWISIHTCTYSA